MRSASRANTSSVIVPSSFDEAGELDVPVRHSSHVPRICTTACFAVKLRAEAISSISDSTSELRNSDER